MEIAVIRWVNFIAFILYVSTAGLTVMYTAGLIYYSSMGEFNLRSCSNINDIDWVIVNSITMLGPVAVFGGAILSWLVFLEPFIILSKKLDEKPCFHY